MPLLLFLKGELSLLRSHIPERTFKSVQYRVVALSIERVDAISTLVVYPLHSRGQTTYMHDSLNSRFGMSVPVKSEAYLAGNRRPQSHLLYLC